MVSAAGCDPVYESSILSRLPMESARKVRKSFAKAWLIKQYRVQFPGFPPLQK